MEIWIRSQDKGQLVVVNNIFISGNSVAFIIDKCVGTLGDYDTEERALEVLNDIESTLVENEAYKMGVKQTTKGKSLVYTHIYKMPEK